MSQYCNKAILSNYSSFFLYEPKPDKMILDSYESFFMVKGESAPLKMILDSWASNMLPLLGESSQSISFLPESLYLGWQSRLAQSSSPSQSYNQSLLKAA